MASSLCCRVLSRASTIGRRGLAGLRTKHAVPIRCAAAADASTHRSNCERWSYFPLTSRRCFSTVKPAPQKETVTIHFKFPDGTQKTAAAKVGENLLDAVISNHLDIDGYGACEGTLACSTCHLIFKQSDFAKLPQKPTDEELDMLDLAYGLSDTSRLGCQVIVTKDMDGWEVVVPGGISDARG